MSHLVWLIVEPKARRPHSGAARFAISKKVPAMSPGRSGVQRGPRPVASGSFASNAHNGDISVAGLGVVDFPTKRTPQVFLLARSLICFWLVFSRPVKSINGSCGWKLTEIRKDGKIKRERMSPCYTTCWEQVPVVG